MTSEAELTIEQERRVGQSDFRFLVEKVYSIPGRGVVTSGRVERGRIAVGDQVGFLGMEGRIIPAVVAAIEVSRRLVETAEAGNEASLLLQGIKKDQIAAGTVLTALPEDHPEASPAPEMSPSSPTYAPAPQPYSARPIHPASTGGRTVLYIAIGILLLLLLMFFQGKWEPRKWDPRKWDPKRKLARVELAADDFQRTAAGKSIPPMPLRALESRVILS